MSGPRKRGETIRQFIVDNLDEHPLDIVSFTAKEFKISRQAVNKHIRKLVADRVVVAKGNTRKRRYRLRAFSRKTFIYALDGLEEDKPWTSDVGPLFKHLPANVRNIWYYGFTEILNNAVEHSGGTKARVTVSGDALGFELAILDDGYGIFKKIAAELGLDDEQHAVLELSKGKLTTDPEHHSGQGIFFSSRMFDAFVIRSEKTSFTHLEKAGDWVFGQKRALPGTGVIMYLRNDSTRTAKAVFDQFASPDDDYEFNKTIVAVHRAQFGDEPLISRSQAKRLLARFDRFAHVVLDFQGIAEIGQAFADEVFRVFGNRHPGTKIMEINTNKDVQRMINRARGH